jgi:outer membrane protein OmpA-like peptidoglycan-associated protein
MKSTGFFRLHRTLTIVLASVVILLLAARIAAPGFILKKMNDHLATFSPLYQIHIRDLDLHFFRMAYSFDDVTGTLNKKVSDPEFMTLKKVDVSIVWRELFRGRVVAGVDVTQAKLRLTTETTQALAGVGKSQAKEDAKNVKDATVPFKLENLRFLDSDFLFSDIAGIPAEQAFRLTHIEAAANNLTPRNENGISMFTAVGAIQDTAKIKAVGQLRTKAEPFEWSVNVELKDFALTELNPIATRMVPVSFKTGTLSLYAAAQSVQGESRGYVKPFLKDLVFLGDRHDFKNVGQLLIEIGGSIGNFFLKNTKNHALATKISFKTVNGKTEVDTAKAIELAISNGFGKGLKQSLDETLNLEDSAKNTVSIDAKMAGAQTGTSFVTEVKFKKGSINLAPADLKRIELAYADASKNAKPDNTTVIIWGDSEGATEKTGDRSAEEMQLAEDRGQAIIKYLSIHQLSASNHLVNMAKRPADVKKFLKTRGARIQEALQRAGHATHNTSKAILLIGTKLTEM